MRACGNVGKGQGGMGGQGCSRGVSCMHACWPGHLCASQPSVCMRPCARVCMGVCVRACVRASVHPASSTSTPTPLHLPPDPTSPHRTHPTPPCQNNAAAAPHAMLVSRHDHCNDRHRTRDLPGHRSTQMPQCATQDAKLQADLTGHRSAQLCNVRRRMQDAAGLTGLNCSPTRTHPSSLLRLLVLTQSHRTPPLFLIILLVLVFLC